MSGASDNVVRVSRVIDAPASALFALFVDTRRHVAFDGSEMLRDSDGTIITAVGDVFLMRMFLEEFGDYVMTNRVVYFEPARRIGWAPTRFDIDGSSWNQVWSYELESTAPTRTLVTEVYDCSRTPEDGLRIMKHGTTWIKRMAATLDRLAQLVETPHAAS